MILALLLPLLQAGGPCSDLPLTPGTSWTYHAAVAWSATADTVVHHESLTWVTRILARRQIDSIVVATAQGWPSELAWWSPAQTPDTSLVVCVGERLYHLAPTTAALGPVADSVLTGRRTLGPDDLILQLPLRVGALFGRDASDRPDRMYAWDVQEVSAVPAAFAAWAHGAADSMFTLAYTTLPDRQVVEFIPGVGIVDYVYHHHGTVADAHAWLVDFRPASGH